MNYLKNTFLVFTVSILWFSCQGESKNENPSAVTVSDEKDAPTPLRNIFQPEHLMGEWKLTEATRDRKRTPSLDSAYFHFEADQVLKTNILGEEEVGKYSLNEKQLTQQTNETIEYTIEKLVADTLIMSMIYKRKKFRVTLEK